eukprot:UN08493
METQQGLIRAFIEAVKGRVDIINISYGEQAVTPNRGAIQEFANLIAQEYGIFVLSSAGNEGPILSSAGSMGATTEHVISVGAMISPEMTQMYATAQPNTSKVQQIMFGHLVAHQKMVVQYQYAV